MRSALQVHRLTITKLTSRSPVPRRISIPWLLCSPRGGVDLIKLDGVTPGSDSYDLSIDNRDDVAAWSKAIQESGRPIWLTVSWDLSEDYLSVWQQYANARRIDQDVECEGDCSKLSNWPRIYARFRDLPGWENDAGRSVGWERPSIPWN